MKLICTLIALLTIIASFTIRSKNVNGNMQYTEKAAQLEKQIEEFAFLASEPGTRIQDVEITRNGDIVFHAGRANQVALNIFRLYRKYDMVFGIALDQLTIHFSLSDKEKISICFRDERIAKEVYESLLALVRSGKDQYVPDLVLDINETVDSINHMLNRLSAFKSNIRVNITGTVIITNSNMQFFNFNLTELASSEYAEGFEVNGIEMIPCAYKKVAAQNWINFNSPDRKMAYIKFYAVSDEELNQLHQLFIHLRVSMMNIMNV